MAKTPVTTVDLAPLDLMEITVPIIGDTPLIVHAWSEKAKRQMLDKQVKAATRGREKKDPRADFLASSYRLKDGQHGIPSVALKNAAVTACTSIGALTKVAARQAFFIMGEQATAPGAHDGAYRSESLVALLGDGPPRMREDLVRVGMGAADLRYRAEYFPWAAEVMIRFNQRVLSKEQILSLLDTAGFAVGLHEWRPEKNGDMGRFHVARELDSKWLAKAKPIFDAPPSRKSAVA